MSLLPFLFLIFVPFISSHLIVVAPAIGIAGQNYPIRITSDGGTITATIYGSANGINNGNTAGFTSVITAGSSTSDITLTIPSSTPTGQYRLDITTTANITAIYRSDIIIWYHPYDIAMELDKPVYQPGQIVYIQLIVIDNQMKPVQLMGVEGVRLEMSDSKQTKLARISNITTNTYGMVTLSLPLSTEPSYGTYTLSVTRDNIFITSISFELMSYQLPKFSVVVASHQTSLTSTSTILSGNVTAMYVYGKPVQGTVSINITQAPYTPWYGWGGIMPIGMMPPMVDAVDGGGGGVAIGLPSGSSSSSSSSSTTKSVLATLTISLDDTGVTTWSIDNWPPQGASVSSNGITITATVTETATGATESGSTDVSYAWQSIQTAIVGSDNAVKPGIPFTCALLAVDVNGQPVDATFTLTVNEQLNGPPYSRPLIQKSITTSQGRVTFEITGVSSAATSISVSVHGESMTASTYTIFGVAYSPSKSYVEISQTSTSLVVGQDASFTIRTSISSTAHTSNTATAIWSIISQGDIITGGTSSLTLSNGASTTELTIPITDAIKGSGTILVYIRLTSGEVIADSLPINVPVTYPLDVTATFNPKSSQPGDEIVVDVDTSGISAHVALAAVDEAVLLVAGKGSRINIQSLLTASDRTLASVATSTSSSTSPYTSYRTRTATADVFINSKVIVLTDISTSIPVINPYQYDGVFPPVAAEPGPVNSPNAGGAAGGGGADNAAPIPTTSKDATSTSTSTAPTRVRSYFPESFLTFKPIITDNTGKATVPVTTPDSITTWNLHAIAMSSRGLGISSTSTLTVMLPLFLDVYLPKVAVRGEIVPITIAIKSYISSAATTVTLTLAPSSQYTIITSSSSTNIAGNNHIYTLPVEGTSIVAVTYIIQPKVLGEIQIAANATSAIYSDGIITSLKITPEGLPRTYTLNQLITLDTSTPTSTVTWSTYLPAEAVPGSATAYLHVTGDLMGQVMSNVEGLVQQPTGCGEQNMINFAPLIYVTSYITSAKLVKPDLVSRAITMMRMGYARELNYRRSDGSFSAFGNSDPVGSIWLSAFVLRCFAQSRVHTNLGMYVDPQVLKMTGDYLVNKQNSGGDYPLIGKVLHDDMTGGTGQVASPALTAYITLTLIETGGYENAVNKGLNYLISQASAVTDNLYQIILLAYTLKRGGSTSSATTSLYTAMKAAAKTDSDGMYWSTTTSNTLNEKASPWCYHCQPKSLQVEMTAYALLTLLAYDDLVTAFPVAKWLLNHRSSLGGYSSTQDTVVALEALSAYAIKAIGNSDMSLSISQDGAATSSIIINAQNSDLLQSKPITVTNGSSLVITATGTGRALIQLAVAYHVNIDTTTPSYTMNVDYAKSNNNDTLTIQTCVQAMNNEKSGMIISEIGLFTGYEPISSSVSALTAAGPASLIRRVDTSPRNVVLYWGDVITTTSPKCITFTASRVMNVDSLQDAVSTTYSYYKPQLAVSKSVSYEATSNPVPTPGPKVPNTSMILLPSTLLFLLVSSFVITTIIA